MGARLGGNSFNLDSSGTGGGGGGSFTSIAGTAGNVLVNGATTPVTTGAAVLSLPSALTGIASVQATSALTLLTNGGTTALTLSAAQNAVFAGSVGLGGQSTLTGVLNFPAATTAPGGIYFGTDTQLYRGSAGSLSLGSTGGTAQLTVFGTNTTAFLSAGATNVILGSNTSTAALLLQSGSGVTALTLGNTQNAFFTGTIADIGQITTQNALAVTTTPGATITNTTVATSGIPQQYSPSLTLLGHGWSGAVDYTMGFRIYAVSGSGTTRAQLNFDSTVNGGTSWTSYMTLNSANGLTTTLNLASGNLTATSLTTVAGVTAAAGVWNLGALRTSTALVVSTTQVIQIAVGGTLYSLMTCTTNP